MIRERHGRYEVVVYLGRGLDGRRRSISRTATTRKKAEAEERRLLAQRDAGTRLDGPEATLEHLCDRWLDVADLEESTRYQARRALARYVTPRLGPVKLERLRPEHLDDLYRLLRRGDPPQRPLAPATVRHVHTYLRAALNLAVRWEWISRNPALRATLPRSSPPQPSPPPTEALLALLAAAATHDPPLYAYLRLASVTGMRRGELCALRRSDLELDALALRKTHALGVGSGAPYEKPTKTGARHALALDPKTVGVLRAHLAWQDFTAEHFATLVAPDGYLFANDPVGLTPWHPQAVSRRFAKLRDRVPEADGVQMRSLRHWMVTQGLEGGASLVTVAGRAGHARASTTSDRYAAWVPASDRALADALGGAL